MAPSRARIPVLGDYMVFLSRSIALDQQTVMATKRAARNRVDLLLIVNDVLHTDTFHSRDTETKGFFSDECAPFIIELVAQAVACCSEKGTLAEKKLKALLNYWALNRLLSNRDIKFCREKVDEGLLLAQGGTVVRKRDYLLPEYHGDRTAPWHDLPASYMLEQMINEPKKPIDPNRIKIKKLEKKSVSPHVRTLLDNYFENIDLKYLPTGGNPTGETEKYALWLDPIGQTVKQDKNTGETATVCNGYGWSLKFCQDMQKHGVPENIKIIRDDLERMEEIPESREMPQRRREDGRFARSPRRRRESSSESGPRRDRSRNRRESTSSYDSRHSYSRSRSPERGHQLQHQPARGRSRVFHDEGQAYDDDRGSGQPRPPPRSYRREDRHPDSQWNGPNAPPLPLPPNGPGGNFAPPPPPPTYGQGFSQPPFLDSRYPPPPVGPGLFPGQFFPPHLVPPPPPPPFQGPGALAAGPLPPAPPNFSGPYPPPPPPPPPVLAGQPNVAPTNHQYGNRYGNNFGHGSGGFYSQDQGGHSSGRVDYSSNGHAGGGYQGNSSSGHSGNQRRARY